MPVPNYPDKHGASAYLTPSAFHESKDVAASDVPQAVVLCYQPPFFDHVVEAHTEAEVEYPDAGRLHSLSGTDGRVGVLGGFGIGGPVTAIAMEHLIELGTERFCVLGGCGGLGGNVARVNRSSVTARSVTTAFHTTISRRSGTPTRANDS